MTLRLVKLRKLANTNKYILEAGSCECLALLCAIVGVGRDLVLKHDMTIFLVEVNKAIIWRTKKKERKDDWFSIAHLHIMSSFYNVTCGSLT